MTLLNINLLTLKRRFSSTLIVTCFLSLTFACSNSNNSAAPPSSDGTGTGVMPGQALLGPIVGAKVSVYNAADFEGQFLAIAGYDHDIEPICETITTSSDVLDKAGLILLTQECIKKGHIYFVEVTGGMDIDVDDDGILDKTPTPHESSIHAVIVGDRMLDRPWKVTRVTDVVYRLVQALFLIKTTPDEFLQRMDQLAPIMVNDVTGDGVIDRNDIFEWNPREHGNLVNPDLLEAAEDHKALTSKQVSLKVNGFTGHVDTLLNANFLAVQGEYAYVSTDSELHVVDISNPSTPRIVNSRISAMVYDITIRDEWLFVLTQMDLAIYDIANPQQMQLLKTVPIPFTALGHSDDGSVWATTPSIGGSFHFNFYTLGESDDPLLPLIANLSLQEFILTLTQGNPLEAAFQIAPTSFSNLELFRMKNNIAILGFMGFSDSTIQIIDFSDRLNPVLISKTILPGGFRFPLDAQLIGNQLHISIGDGRLSDLSFKLQQLVFDLSDPDNPVQMPSPSVFLNAFHQLDNVMYSWESNNTLTARDANSYTLLNSISLPNFADNSFQVYGQGFDFMFGVEDLDSLAFNPGTLEMLSNLKRTYKRVGRFAIQNGYAYFAAAEYGLLIYPLP